VERTTSVAQSTIITIHISAFPHYIHSHTTQPRLAISKVVPLVAGIKPSDWYCPRPDFPIEPPVYEGGSVNA
jgi:hypothetical protein